MIMSRPFKHFNESGYPLIDFLNDISRWLGDPPEFIYVQDFDGFKDIFLGVFIFNPIDRSYYKVEKTGGKPKYTLDDCVPFVDSRALNSVTIHNEERMKKIMTNRLDKAYNLAIDLPRYRRWLAKYKPNRYK